MGRAVLLVAVAVVVGVVLLHRSGGGGTTTSAVATATTAKARTTTTARSSGGKTTVTVPVVTTTTAPARPASAVKVLVANGSAVRGLAGTTAAKLHTAGYNTLAVVNATQQVTASLVYFQAGYQREAAAVGQVLGLPVTAVLAMPSPPPVTNLSTANVLIVTGPELGGAAASTATTARTATTLHTTTTAHTATTVHSTTTVKP